MASISNLQISLCWVEFCSFSLFGAQTMLGEIIALASDLIDQPISFRRFLLIGSAFNKVSVLLYSPYSVKPILVAKIPIGDDGRHRCATEYEGITFLLKNPIKKVIAATPIGIIQHAGSPIYLQSYQPAQLMLHSLPLFRKQFSSHHFISAADILSDIYLATKNSSSETPSGCFQHGDFWCGNIGLKGSDFVLYDLEFSNCAGHPVFDLLHFGLYYYRVLCNVGKLRPETQLTLKNRKHARDRRQFELLASDVITVMCEDNKFSNIMRAAIRRYAEKCQLDEQSVGHFVRQFILEDRKIAGLPRNWHDRFMLQWT